jgi:hypothetical protein
MQTTHKLKQSFKRRLRLLRLGIFRRRGAMLSGQEHPRFLSYPDWSDQQIYRSLEKRRMIAFNPVSQEQEYPAAHEERSAPNPFCE